MTDWGQVIEIEGAPSANGSHPDFADGPQPVPDMVELGGWIARQWAPGIRYAGLDFWEWKGGCKWEIIPGGETPTHVVDRILTSRWDFVESLSYERRRSFDQGEAGDYETALLELITSKEFLYQVKSSVMPGLRTGLTRPFPQRNPNSVSPMDRQRISTSEEVIDLLSGERFPHDPAVSDNRAVLGGCYRPESMKSSMTLVEERFRPVLSSASLEILLDVWGQTLSGRSQTYRSFILLLGGEGAGKGGTSRLLLASAGDRGMALGRDWFSRERGEIDAIGWMIVVYQPLIVTADESLTGSRGVVERVLNFTGDNIMGPFRLPYSKTPERGAVPAALWVTGVEPPRLPLGSGLDRRMVPIEFPYRGGDEDKMRDAAGFSQDLLDAMVTVGIERAKRVWQEGYVPPSGEDGFRRQVKAEVDPLAAFLAHLPREKGDGVLSTKVAQMAQEAGLGENRPVGPNAVTRKVRLLAKSDPEFPWEMGTGTSGDARSRAVLRWRLG